MMDLTKKAEGLSLTTIVIAALVLLILVVLTLIFTGRMNLWGEGMDDAQACQNYCKGIGKVPQAEILKGENQQCTSIGGTVIPTVNGRSEDYLCCCISSTVENAD